MLFSNVKFLSVIGIIYWGIIEFSINYAWYIEQQKGGKLYVSLTNNSFYIILAICFFILGFKIRKCRDELFMNAEIKKIGIVFLFMIPTLFIFLQFLHDNVLAIVAKLFIDICMIIISN